MNIKTRLDERKLSKQRKIKEYEELTISDDFMFYKVMQNSELCKELLEIILSVEIEKLEYISRQKVLRKKYDGKGIRLDVYTKDAEGTVYNLEMQAIKKSDIPKRSRYYQGVIDTDNFKEGADYNSLNKSIIIFICRFDLFKKGRPIYTFKSFCEEEVGLELGDEATRIFINSKWILDKEKWDKSLVTPRMASLLRYIEEGKVTDEYTKKLECEISKVKQDMRWRKKYMVYEKNINYAREEGIVIGEERGQELMGRLYNILLTSGQVEAATRASTDPEYREQLFKEYGLK